MPWEKGQSGNPGGRPRHPDLAEARKAAQKRLGVVVARLSSIVRRGDAKDVAAAARLLCQIAGVSLTPESPTQPDTRPPATLPVAMTPEALAERLRGMGLEQ